MQWPQLTNAELLEHSGSALAELRRRGIVRTGNAPAGDLAERLVADAMGGELAPNSQKSWDVLAPPATPGPWQRIQVKARVVSDVQNLGQRQVSAFRSWDCESVMFVLFDPLYVVREAALVPAGVVKDYATTSSSPPPTACSQPPRCSISAIDGPRSCSELRYGARRVRHRRPRRAPRSGTSRPGGSD